MQFLLLKSFHPFLSVYNLQTYSESGIYVHESAKSANFRYAKCFTSHFQKLYANWAFTLSPFFFKSKYSDSSLPSTAPNYKAFLNELKLRRTTPTRKEDKRVLLV